MKQPTARATTTFDRTTELQPLERTEHSAVFAADLDELWSSLVGTHGGYLTALAIRAAEQLVSGRVVRTITTNFQRPGAVGAATLTVTEQRHGRSLSTVIFELQQNQRVLNLGRITMTEPNQTGVEWAPLAPIELAPLQQCDPLDPETVTVGHFRNAIALLDPISLPFTGGERALIRGYVRPIERRPIDAAWLAMMTDWFPPPAFVRLDPPTGGISIDLTSHIHRTLPAADAETLEHEWLTAAFEITQSAGGLATETGRIATRDGVVLAESMQTRWMK